MAKKTSKKVGVQWIAGIAPMPVRVREEDGSSFLAEGLIWIHPEGFVLGHMIDKPGTLHARAVESFRAVVDKPRMGPPHTPDSIRVASSDLAHALRESGVSVVVAPAPEVDAVMAEMDAYFGEAEVFDPYLSGDVDENTVAAFFRAAAALYRATPWEFIPRDRYIFSLTIEAFDLRDAVLSVVGESGEAFGVLVARSMEDFDAFLDAEGHSDHLPMFSISFEPADEMGPDLQKEIAVHQWEVADAKFYPWLTVTEAGARRSLTHRDLALAEAVATALTKLVGEKAAMKKALSGSEQIARSYAVSTEQGLVEVKLAFPFSKPQVHTGVLASLQALEDADRLGEDTYEVLCKALLAEFNLAPESQTAEPTGACGQLFDFAADHIGVSVASLSARELHEIVFEIIPRKLSANPSIAEGFIAELRAFYAFLKRVYALQQADACLRVLSGDAAERLAEELGNPDSFGMAKSIVAMGAKAGFDVGSEEGLRAWMTHLQTTGLPPSFPLPFAQPKTAAPARRADPAKAKKRKDARSARKKNR